MTRLPHILATAAIIGLLWLGITLFLVQKQRADIDDATQISRTLTHAFEENMRRSIEAIDTTIRALRVARAQDPAHFNLAAWERDSGLTRELTLQLAIADRTGDVVASNLPPTGKRVSIANRPHFRATRDQPGDALFISQPVIGRVSGRWSVQFVRKLFDPGGGFDGVIVASLDPSFLSRFYSSLAIGRGALLLAGQDGIVRAAAPAGVAELASNLTQTPLMAGAAAAPLGTVRMAATQDGIDRIYGWRQVAPYGLVVAVGLSVADALAEYQRDLQVGVTAGIVLTLVAIIVATVLARHRRDATRSQTILRAAVDNISQGLLVVDAQRRVPVLNARGAELLGLPPALARPGVAFDAVLAWQLENGEFEGEAGDHVRALVEAGGIEQGSSVYRRTRRNGMALEFRTKVLETGLAVRTITDITETENSARVLAAARDAAEAAAQARSEFLAVMSHEIRTPLNGVIGVADLLDGMELGPAQRDYVRLIRDSGSHLLALVNDILDFSRLEAARVQLEEVTFDPQAVIHDVIAMFQVQAGAKGLVLSAHTAADVPAAVLGDPGRLRQILLNLVSNAVKFTQQGWVTVSLEQEAAPDGRVRLLFCVADSGIGIAPEAIEQMFEEFTQLDGSISRRFGGSGLGLAICRKLVALMGGGITVESQSGVGSFFRFDVILKLAPGQPAADVAPVAETEPSPVPGLRVLVAADNATNRLVALRLLERLGHRADAVSDGAEAMTALGQKQYDIVLMDVMMPEMDGLTATRLIRAAERQGRRVTIVGLTAGSDAETLADCLAAGMDAVTTKPVTAARLRSAIAEGMDAATQRSAPPPAPGIMPRISELKEELGEEAVQEILAAFIEDIGANLKTIQEAAARSDTRAVYRLAHVITGAARNVGATALATRAAALEQQVGSLSPSDIAAEIRTMQTEFDAAMADMESALAAAL
ncbi:MAG: ATP-binding protein [Rhodopila sp.]